MYHCIPQADQETVALSVYRTIELLIPRADRETVAVSVYRTIDPSSRSRNCRIIGLSNYRSLEQIEKLSQYWSLEYCGVIASHIRSLPQKEGVWEDMRMLNDKTRCARAPAFKGAGHLCSSDRYCDSFEVPAR